MNAPIGILLLNTGTPEKAEKKQVAKYLRQFLMDPRVIDLPWFIRWPLIQGIIIPTRAKASTEAYQKIWTDEGSPLLVNSLAFKQKLSEKLGNHYVVELGMRYGQPNISSAIEKLKKAHCVEWIIIPLFPQYASASTGSAVEAFLKSIMNDWNIPSLTMKTSFYNHPAFIDCYSKIIQKNIPSNAPDFFLFSYHGLPWRHIQKSQCGYDCQNVGNDEKICPAISSSNDFCYRAQCYATSKLLAEKLRLPSDKYATAFQSRLGKTPWITPYSDLFLEKLIQQDVKNLFVACPSFVADCLETLEEIGVRMKEQWLELGGESFTLSPCLNAEDDWVNGFIKNIMN
jgi:protoporphyrin/coproporphyrin ferrochelatase